MLTGSMNFRAIIVPFVPLFFYLCLFLQPLESVYILRHITIAENGAMVFAGNTLGLSKQVDQNQSETSDAIGAFSTLDTSQEVGTYLPETTQNYLQNSSAILSIPPGSTVLHAELIWSGSYGYLNDTTNMGEDSNIVLLSADGPINFTTPDSVVHAVVPNPAASQVVQNPTVVYPAGNYVRSTDVTALVQANGSGTYSVGGVPTTESVLDNTHDAAGWTLAVVYRNPTLPTQSMSSEVTIFIPPLDPVSPAEFTGKVDKCKYLTRTEYFLTATWTPVALPNLIGYRIYFRGQVVDEIQPQRHLIFRTCLKNKKSANDYSVTAVFTENIESTHANIRIIP